MLTVRFSNINKLPPPPREGDVITAPHSPCASRSHHGTDCVFLKVLGAKCVHIPGESGGGKEGQRFVVLCSWGTRPCPQTLRQLRDKRKKAQASCYYPSSGKPGCSFGGILSVSDWTGSVLGWPTKCTFHYLFLKRLSFLHPFQQLCFVLFFWMIITVFVMPHVDKRTLLYVVRLKYRKAA